MGSIGRGALVYLVLLAIFRLSGKRSLADITTFDFVLTLIISESVQQAMIDSDNSATNALLLVLTLVGLDIVLSLLKQRWKKLEDILDGRPLVIMEKGRLHRERMRKERIDEDDILGAARTKRGLDSFDEIESVVLEPNGGLSVIPKR